MFKIMILGALGFGAYYWYTTRKYLAVIVDGAIIPYDTSNVASQENADLIEMGQPVLIEQGEVTHEYRKERFMGGWLLDETPINVIVGQGWIETQVEALQSAGKSPDAVMAF